MIFIFLNSEFILFIMPQWEKERPALPEQTLIQLRQYHIKPDGTHRNHRSKSTERENRFKVSDMRQHRFYYCQDWQCSGAVPSG